MNYKGYILQFPAFIEMIGEFAGDLFGAAVDMDCEGNLVVVGAYNYHSAAVNYSGKAYIFEDEAILHELEPDDPQYASRFGAAVAISGTTVVVGAHWWDGDVDAQGKAYVYAEGVLAYTLTADDPQSSALFGYAVAIDTGLVVVGSYFWDGVYDQQGKVYVYLNGLPQYTLTAPDPHAADTFGYAVAVEGTTIVVGAMGWDGTTLGQGKVYVFVSGALSYSLIAPDPGQDSHFGNAVAIDGDTIVVGAFTWVGTEVSQGKVYVFEAGVLVHELIAPDPQYNTTFGRSVAVAGDTVVVGAQGWDGEGENQGKAYIFKDGVLIQEVEAEDPQAGAQFGTDVAVNCEGTSMIVGAPAWDGTSLDGTGELLADRGRAYVLPISSGYRGHDVEAVRLLPLIEGVVYVYLLRVVVATGEILHGELKDGKYTGTLDFTMQPVNYDYDPASDSTHAIGSAILKGGVLTIASAAWAGTTAPPTHAHGWAPLEGVTGSIDLEVDHVNTEVTKISDAYLSWGPYDSGGVSPFLETAGFIVLNE